MRAHGPTGIVTIKSLLVAAALCLLLGRSLRRTKIQVEMIVGTEKIRGVEVSAHTGTQVIVASVLIKQSNTL